MGNIISAAWSAAMSAATSAASKVSAYINFPPFWKSLGIAFWKGDLTSDEDQLTEYINQGDERVIEQGKAFFGDATSRATNTHSGDLALSTDYVYASVYIPAYTGSTDPLFYISSSEGLKFEVQRTITGITVIGNSYYSNIPLDTEYANYYEFVLSNGLVYYREITGFYDSNPSRIDTGDGAWTDIILSNQSGILRPVNTVKLFDTLSSNGKIGTLAVLDASMNLKAMWSPSCVAGSVVKDLVGDIDLNITGDLATFIVDDNHFHNYNNESGYGVDSLEPNVIKNNQFVFGLDSWAQSADHWQVVDGRAYHPLSNDNLSLSPDTADADPTAFYRFRFNYEVVQGIGGVTFYDNVGGQQIMQLHPGGTTFDMVLTGIRYLQFKRNNDAEFYIDNVTMEKVVTYAPAKLHGRLKSITLNQVDNIVNTVPPSGFDNFVNYGNGGFTGTCNLTNGRGYVSIELVEDVAIGDVILLEFDYDSEVDRNFGVRHSFSTGGGDLTAAITPIPSNYSGSYKDQFNVTAIADPMYILFSANYPGIIEGQRLTITNLKISIIKAVDGINKLSGTPTGLDTVGNVLTYKGNVPLPMDVYGRNILSATAGQSIVFADLGGATLVSSEGTATVSLSGNALNITGDGTLYNVLLSDGTLLPMAEGGQSDTVYDVSGNGNHGTLSGFDLTTAWGWSDEEVSPNYLNGFSHKEQLIFASTFEGCYIQSTYKPYYQGKNLTNSYIDTSKCVITSVVINGNVWELDFSSTGTTESNFQFKTGPLLNVVAGETYRFSIDMKTSKPASARFSMGRNGTPYTAVSSYIDYTTSTEWVRHVVDLTVTLDDDMAVFRSFLGDQGAIKYYFRNLRAVKLNGGESATYGTESINLLPDQKLSGDEYLPAINSTQDILEEPLTNPAGDWHNDAEVFWRAPLAPKLFLADLPIRYLFGNTIPWDTTLFGTDGRGTVAKEDPYTAVYTGSLTGVLGLVVGEQSFPAEILNNYFRVSFYAKAAGKVGKIIGNISNPNVSPSEAQTISNPPLKADEYQKYEFRDVYYEGGSFRLYFQFGDGDETGTKVYYKNIEIKFEEVPTPQDIDIRNVIMHDDIEYDVEDAHIIYANAEEAKKRDMVIYDRALTEDESDAVREFVDAPLDVISDSEDVLIQDDEGFYLGTTEN